MGSVSSCCQSQGKDDDSETQPIVTAGHDGLGYGSENVTRGSRPVTGNGVTNARPHVGFAQGPAPDVIASLVRTGYSPSFKTCSVRRSREWLHRYVNHSSLNDFLI